MNQNDKTIKKTELIIRVLEYAQKHKLDINDRNDVKKILETFNPTPMTTEELDEFMMLLQNADTFMEMSALKKSKEESKLPN